MSSFSVENIDPSKSLGETSTSLEFLLVSFCSHFDFKPKQAAGLLTQGGKYLAYVVAKGLRGNHEVIISWYQDIYANLRHLVALIDKEEANGSVSLILSSLKSGFISKNIETAIWCCRLYAKLAAEFSDLDLMAGGWDWFVSEGGGLEGCLLSCRRYGPDIKPQTVAVISQFARNRFFELFTIHLRNLLSEPIHYFTIMNEFLPCFCDIKAAKTEMLSAGIIDYWLDLGLREATGENTDLKLAALNFVCDLWVYLPNVVELHEELASTILTMLKRGCRDKLNLLRFACLGKLFRLLDVFTEERNSYAPVIYKTLTFSLVENYEDMSAREFILDNFAQIFTKIDSIPVGILLEPFIKQLQVSSTIVLNTVDFTFFCVVSNHSRLSVKNAVQLIDILGKIYANELEFSQAAAVPFLMIANKFTASEAVQEYLFRFCRYAIKTAYNIAVRRLSPDAIQKIMMDHRLTKEKMQILQRNAMLDMVIQITAINIEPLNDKIKSEAIKTNASLRRMNISNSQALLTILNAMGVDPENLEVEKMDEKDKEINRGDTNPHTLSSADSMIIVPRGGRARQDIEKVRKQRLEQEAEKKAKEEKARLALESKKRALKKQLEKRKIEVSQKTQGEHTLVGLSDQDKEGIDYIEKRYRKALRILFKKYASTGYSNKDMSSFDRLADNKSTLSASEFYKLLKEQGVSAQMISPDEVSSIVKAYCHYHKKSQQRIHFPEFIELLTHVALGVYSKPPKDLSHLTPAISFKTLLDHFKSSGTVSSSVYDDPDPGFGDRDVVKQLNKLLETDPEAELPEHFKRYADKEIEVSYRVPDILQYSESFTYSIEILDEILLKKFGFHILEPLISYKTVFRAKGLLPKAKVVSNESSEKMGITYHKGSYQPALPVDLNLTPGIKYEMARLTGQVPSNILSEVGSLMGDIIHSVDIGADHLVQRTDRRKLTNKALQAKEQEKYMAELEEFRKEKRRKLRKQVIEEKLKKARDEKSAKQTEIERSLQIEETKKKEMATENERKKAFEREKNIQKLAKWKAEKETNFHRVLEEKEKGEKAKEEERKQQLKDFLKKEKQKIGSLLKDTFEQKSQMRIEAAEKKTPKLPSITRKVWDKKDSSKSFDLKERIKDSPKKSQKVLKPPLRNYKVSDSSNRAVSKSSGQKLPPRK